MKKLDEHIAEYIKSLENRDLLEEKDIRAVLDKTDSRMKRGIARKRSTRIIYHVSAFISLILIAFFVYRVFIDSERIVERVKNRPVKAKPSEKATPPGEKETDEARESNKKAIDQMDAVENDVSDAEGKGPVITDVRIYPSVLPRQSVCEYFLTGESTVEFRLFDMKERFVRKISGPMDLKRGFYKVHVNLTGLSDEEYKLVITINGVDEIVKTLING